MTDPGVDSLKRLRLM